MRVSVLLKLSQILSIRNVQKNPRGRNSTMSRGVETINSRIPIKNSTVQTANATNLPIATFTSQSAMTSLATKTPSVNAYKNNVVANGAREMSLSSASTPTWSGCDIHDVAKLININSVYAISFVF